jgi:hypothetical protein
MRSQFWGKTASTTVSWIGAGSRRVLVALSVLATGVACDELTNLEQEDPSQILAGTVYAPANATLLVNGAIGDFECAFFRYTTAAALLGDELVNAFANTANDNYDRRTHPLTGPYAGGCGGHQQPGVYTSLSVARASADTILARLEEWTDAQMPTGVNRQQLIGQAAAYAGYSLVLLGEGMCSAAINVGPELMPEQLFAQARSRFEKAIPVASEANDQMTVNLARVGLARTLLNLAYVPPNTPASPDVALLSEAATVAAAVPTTFAGVNAVANLTGTARQQNTIFAHTGGTGTSNFSSVDPTFENLTFGGVADPRVRVINTGTLGTDNRTTLRLQTKYANLGSPAPIARRTEARLILAEANAFGIGGTPQDAVNIINALHQAAGIPNYDPNAPGALSILNQVREERRRELFLESHRLGDMHRYDLPLIPAVGTAYPRGGTYSDQRCFPLPAVERNNNPNIPDV